MDDMFELSVNKAAIRGAGDGDGENGAGANEWEPK